MRADLKNGPSTTLCRKEDRADAWIGKLMTPHYPESDRRAFQRRPFRTMARMTLAAGSVTELRTTDLSEGGIGIVVSASPPIGLSFRIEFDVRLGDGAERTVATQVLVVNSILARDEDGFKVGLKFDSLEQDDLLIIRRFVSRT